MPSARAACHCPAGTASAPARTISAIEAEVNSARPSQSARNSGVSEAPPEIRKPSSTGRDQPPTAPATSHATTAATQPPARAASPAPTSSQRRAAA